MFTLALLAVVVQTGAMSPAPNTRHRAVSALSRSEPATTNASRLRLLLRIDAPTATTTGIRIADLMETLRTIWRPYAEIAFGGIAVEAATYDEALRLLISERPQRPGSAGGVVLGWIEFLDGRPRNTITLSIAAAYTLMHQGKWLGRAIDTLPLALRQRFVTRALSRSAAHEIGHYLLRSSAHAVRGLMRERMTVEEIMDDAPALNQLLPSEVAMLNQRLAGALPEAVGPNPRPAIVPLRERTLSKDVGQEPHRPVGMGVEGMASTSGFYATESLDSDLP